MNLTTITRTAGRVVLQTKKNSPTVMFVAGLVGVTTAAVMASRATLRLDEILEPKLDLLEDVNSLEHSDYSSQDKVQDKVIIYGDIVFSLGKLYGPALIVGGLGVACLAGSHNILTKRNAALTAAYAGLERTYAAYRDRVRKEIGDEKEEALHYEVVKEEAKKGKELALKYKGDSKFKGYSPYAKFFDESSKNWERNPERNLYFISCQQRWLNDLLHRRGYLLLNEVYESLGLPHTSAGCVVGWTMYEDGDNYVDFGIFDHHTNEVKNFVNGFENNVLLDFNVDGVVYDKIER